MTTSKELFDLSRAADDAARALVETAESAADGAGRELTTEESAEFDELIQKRDAYMGRANRLKAVEDSRSAQRTTTPPPIDNEGSGRVPETRQCIPAVPKRPSRLKHIKGENASERAYRAGRWYLAVAGKRSSQEWCRNNGLELRVHSEGTNVQGGYLVPDEIDNTLIDLREQYGVFRQYARVSNMMSDTLSRRRRTGGLTAYPVGEGDAITESTKSWDWVTLVAKKWGVLSTVTTELNEDAVINVGDDLSGEIAYAFANKEDDCGFNGTGTSAYHGIVGVRSALLNLSSTRADISGLTVGAGNAWSELVLTDFEAVVGKLPVYADTPNVRWFAHKTFYATVMMKLQLAAGGNAASDIASGGLPSFLGYPVVFSQVLAKAEANDQVCCLLGDLSLAADFGDRRITTIAFSDSATVGSVNVFESDEIAVRGTERFDINVHDVGDQNATAASQNPGPIVGLLTAAS